MKTIKKHISLFVLAIFAFPIVFQPVHIVWHYSHDKRLEICCHESCDSTNHSDDCSLSPQHSSHCPVCDYQIVINSLPAYYHFQIAVPVIIDQIYFSFYQHPDDPVYFDKSSRAPPVA